MQQVLTYSYHIWQQLHRGHRSINPAALVHSVACCVKLLQQLTSEFCPELALRSDLPDTQPVAVCKHGS